MGLHYEHLDSDTRALMSSEIESDIQRGAIYLSNYLNEDGCQHWPDLLRDAARSGSDDNFAEELRQNGCFRLQVQRRKPKGGFTMAAVPINAAQTLAEAQFNMYYMRALAIRAKQDAKSLIVYRAKVVENPRESSERMIGTRLDPDHVLNVLRSTVGVDPSIEIPLPNSGLTVRLI